MGALADNGKIIPNKPKEYKPGKVEKMILDYVVREFNQNAAIMAPTYRRWNTARLMSEGLFVRNPDDNGPFRDLYRPVIQGARTVRSGILTQRLAPNTQTFEFVEIKSDEPLDPATVAAMKQSNPAFAQLADEQLSAALDAVMTVSFRQVLRRSNFSQWLKKAITDTSKYGVSITFVDKTCVQRFVVDQPEEEMDDFSSLGPGMNMGMGMDPMGGGMGMGMETEPPANVDQEYLLDPATGAIEEIEPEPQGNEVRTADGGIAKPQLIFDGIRFDCVSPFSIAVPDLKSEGGISKLPYINVYVRQDYSFMTDHKRTVPEDFDPYLPSGKKQTGGDSTGSYVNVECLNPRYQGSVPSQMPTSYDGENDINLDGEEFEFGYMNGSQDMLGPAARSFPNIMRIGRFRFYDMIDCDKPENQEDEVGITKRDLEKFLLKFGITEAQLKTCDQWVLEWIVAKETNVDASSSLPASVLVRFEPYFLPPEEVGTSIPIECRYHLLREGKTFAQSDYTLCGGEEVMFNDSLEDYCHQSERSARPMAAVDLTSVDHRLREIMQDESLVQYRKDGVVFRNRPSMSGSPMFEYLLPPKGAIISAVERMQVHMDAIERDIGVAEQLRGGSGKTETATESSIQSSYLEQSIRSEQVAYESELVSPALRRAFALMLNEQRRYTSESSQPIRMMAIGNDVQVLGDAFSSLKAVPITITPEMVDRGYRVNLLTSSTTGSAQQQMAMLERLGGLGMKFLPMLQSSGKVFEGGELLDRYASLANCPSLVRNMSPQEIQAYQQQMMMAQGGGNPGGAGTERPGYERSGPELSAPGEQQPGQVPRPQNFGPQGGGGREGGAQMPTEMGGLG